METVRPNFKKNIYLAQNYSILVKEEEETNRYIGHQPQRTQELSG